MINRKYTPQYPVLDRAEMVPREQIRLIPDNQLSPLDRAELIRLREDKVGYKFLIADTPENRQNIGIKTTYFQMVAYKEGWTFNPEKYQVEFVEPNHFLLSEEGTQTRIWEFEGETKMGGLSPEKRAGFVVHRNHAVRMRNENADGLANKVLSFLRDNYILP